MIPRAHIIEWQKNAPWQSNAEIITYKLEELLGTKLKALYQPKKLIEVAIPVKEISAESVKISLLKARRNGEIAW
jgi:hypothetical protein